MFIVYGVRYFIKDLGYFGEMVQCPNCQRVHKNRIIKTSKWIHIMYIPFIPVGADYKCICPTCFYGYDLPKNEAKTLLQYPDNNQYVNTFFYHHMNNKNGYEIWTQDVNTGEQFCVMNNLTKYQIKNFKKNMGLKKLPINEVN